MLCDQRHVIHNEYDSIYAYEAFIQNDTLKIYQRKVNKNET